MRYFTSDLHFGHKPIIEFCGRPFMTVQDMNEILVWNINNTIKKDDLLYVLGDFSFYPKDNNVQIIKSINCPVVLIRGNHDHSGRIRNVGFADMFTELDIILGSHLVTLSHFPFAWDVNDHRYGKGEYEDKYAGSRPKDVGQWLLHGHTHSRERIDRARRTIHVGTDAWNYSPISETDVLNLINEKA